MTSHYRWRWRLGFCVAWLVLASLELDARAQPGNADDGFVPNSAPSGYGLILAFAVQKDGRIIVGGEFSYLAGQPRNNIARFSVDGVLDADFNPGTDGRVYALAVQPDGKVLVGRFFGTLAGFAFPGIGRLEAAGTRDSTFNAGTGYAPSTLFVHA